ncbi:olfactory receptor 14C36-like [Alligator mississippiensis]|uniref:olfactory receptor 14C36-like n=1 Tax=Alligator mississippiensis TaxID=8496 RepID=UPI0028774A32|nr:olfactory receptor 14C36-like [Alligator mississippiensis]
MNNQSIITDFLLLRFFETWELQVLHFVVFLVIYLAALLGNVLIITVVALEQSLHTPMYFFLLNLSFLDLCYISTTVPKSMANSITNSRLISFSGCVAQVFLVITLAAAELAFLLVMAYDRYVAVCLPLHYRIIMNRDACVQMAGCCWFISLLYSVLHTGNTFRLHFCQSNIIGQFFCDIPQLLKISCSSTQPHDILMLVLAAVLGGTCFALIVVSYSNIFLSVLHLPSTQGKHKAFSTCVPHLTVFCLFLGTATFTYTQPRSASSLAKDLLAAVFYSVLPPVLNPNIYSLRNKEIKEAVSKLLVRAISFPK